MGFRSSEILRQRLGGRSNSSARKRLSQNQRSPWSYYTRHFIVSIAEQSSLSSSSFSSSLSLLLPPLLSSSSPSLSSSSSQLVSYNFFLFTEIVTVKATFCYFNLNFCKSIGCDYFISFVF